MKNEEVKFSGLKISGFLAIFVFLVVELLCVILLIYGVNAINYEDSVVAGAVAIIISIAVGILFFWAIPAGLFQIEPNQARVMVLFGRYKGTLCDNGFFWVNPLISKRNVSLRARNLDIKPIKVNDKMGNPIMIGSVFVWKVKDTYKAFFDIDSSVQGYGTFVATQSDAALRQVAGMYAYDNNEHGSSEVTLRSDSGEVSQRLEQELNSRLAIAGIEIVEARINYLAYAAEIASVMLRRQQADAIIAAREKIVEGAVSMVQLALEKLSRDNVVELDEERKAAMVSNLLVVLCADEAAQPVVNTGTLHH